MCVSENKENRQRFDLQIYSDEELGNLNEFALYVITRYYPLISSEEIVLPPAWFKYVSPCETMVDRRHLTKQ